MRCWGHGVRHIPGGTQDAIDMARSAVRNEPFDKGENDPRTRSFAYQMKINIPNLQRHPFEQPVSE
jgi:hypothetical protein